MMHPYISGPMSNYEHHNFPAFFACEERLIELGHKPINPARLTPDCTWESAARDALENAESWESCIRRDVEAMLDADSICLLPGWNTSRGACLELVLAVSMGYPVLIWDPKEQTVKQLPVYDSVDIELYYNVAVNHLKKIGTISPLDMYNPSRDVLY